MSIGRRWCCVAVWAELWAGVSGFAQTTALSGTDSSAVLSAMAAQAAVIFAGHVTAISRHDDAGFVDVTFAIDEPVVGCGSAAQFDLREWVGLWAGHAPRYRIGQRLLMLLHAPNATGLSSPVNGLDGAIPLLGAGAPALMDASGNVAADAGAGGVSTSMGVDLSWVQTRALRGVQPPKTVLTRRPTLAAGAPLAAPTVVLSLGDGVIVPFRTVLAGLRGVVVGSR